MTEKEIEFLQVQSAKILLLPSKCELIFVTLEKW